MSVGELWHIRRRHTRCWWKPTTAISPGKLGQEPTPVQFKSLRGQSWGDTTWTIKTFRFTSAAKIPPLLGLLTSESVCHIISHFNVWKLFWFILFSRFVGKMNPDRRVRLGVDCLVTHRENLATEVIMPDFAFLVAHSSESKHHAWRIDQIFTFNQWW